MSQRRIRIVNRLNEVGREQWDHLVGRESPFLEWDWLDALEETECVHNRQGWSPHHLLLEEDGVLVGACPLYLKHNSEGEFVFDHEFAHAAESAGLPYYPKLLVGIPFTPAGGARFLTPPEASQAERVLMIRQMGEALAHVCESNGLSSIHVNFCTLDEVRALEPLGFIKRVGMQYHWENRGYQNFEDYLQAFRSKRRNQIRRERRDLEAAGVNIRVLTGDDVTEALAPTLYALYKGHIDRLYWGRLYLTPEFFQQTARRFKRNLCWVVAEQNGEVVAGTYNVQKDGVFYGRYWGAFKEIRHLHFNVCYYRAIEHCIENGLQRFEPGAGGEFKQVRGFDPRPTYSAHYFSQPALKEAVEGYLAQERQRMSAVIDHLDARSQLKPATKAKAPRTAQADPSLRDGD